MVSFNSMRAFLHMCNFRLCTFLYLCGNMTVSHIQKPSYIYMKLIYMHINMEAYIYRSWLVCEYKVLHIHKSSSICVQFYISA